MARIVPFLARRLALTLVTLAFVSVVIYAATLVVPANPAKVIIGRGATPEQIEAFRHRVGLDRDPVTGYLYWAGNFVRGDWGESILSQESVTKLVLPPLARTVLLALVAFAIAAPISCLFGLGGGKRVGSAADFGLSLGVLGLGALPEFVIGVTLSSVFAVSLQLLPVTSSALTFGDFGAKLEALMLPGVTLALTVIPYMTRQIRVAVSEVAAAPYMRAAALRGLGTRQLTWRHLVPTVGGRVVNVLALNLAELIAGVVVVEFVFAYPGAGFLLVQSINSADVTVVQAIALAVGSAYIVLNFVADALVVLLNPRLRRTGAG